MTDANTAIDRSMVRQMVEEFWRLLILQGHNWGQARPTMNRAQAEAHFGDQARDISRRFTARMEATAGLLPPAQAKAFLQMVDEEDTICFEEHQRNPAAFHRRLALELNPPPLALQPVKYRRQGMGEMSVRTAVRATILELVWSLFRR